MRGLAIALVAVLAGAGGLALAGPGVAQASALTVTNCDDSGPGSLAGVVASASAGDIINFDPALSCPPASPIMLPGTLSIHDLTIDGPGAETMAVSGGTSGTSVLATSGQVGISGLTIEGSNNTNSANGGGIDNTGTTTVTDSTISGNTTGANGGGIENTGAMTVTDSTISGNTGLLIAGGIYNLGTMAVTDSTISGNFTAGDGGGIYNAGTMTVTDSTISGNTAGAGSGIYNNGTLHAGGTIVAGNTGSSCGGDIGITSVGYNLTDRFCGLTQQGDVIAADPGLGPLADNGGPTQTMLPRAGSPAVGVIPAGTTVSIDGNDVSLCPRTDQRGVASTPGANCTIGAVEVPAPITVTVSGSQVYGGSPAFTQTNTAPAGVTLDTSNLTCTTAGGAPLGSLTVGSYTLDGSSCTGVSASGPGNYQIDYVGAANGFTVTKAAPQITWNNPAAITWGTPLSAAQLDATASVPGTFTYAPPAGTVLGPGAGQPLSVSFQPTDSTDYTGATAGVTIDVVPPTACITGKYLGPLVIGNGQIVCVEAGAVITGGVIIQPGGALYMTGGTIKGSLSAAGAAAITMCGGSLSGSVTITGSTGPLDIGTCGRNTISGSVSITGNTGGLTYQNNVVSGSLTITGNTGGTTIGSGNKTTGTVTTNNNT